MIVTDIKTINNKRYEVYLDEKLAFILYKGELRSFSINIGEELKEQFYEEIINEILPKRAFARCEYLLEKRDYTEFELRKKMKMSYYPDKAIEFSLNKLKSYGFIDDLKYSVRYIEANINKKSKPSIERKLFSKGIKKEIISKAFEIINEEGFFQNEDNIIINILRKRHYYESDKSAKEKSKQFRFLLSKGFSSEAIKRNLELNNGECDCY